jgi:hypothetical protein
MCFTMKKCRILLRKIALVSFTASLSIGVTTDLACADTVEYSGKGGMLAYDIKKDVYVYHFLHGFTGEDAAGWDPNLQYVWSRVAAAKVCGITVSIEGLMPKLIEQFGQDKMVHEIVGIGFHEVQIRANKEFCTVDRKNEIAAAISEFTKNKFPKIF